MSTLSLRPLRSLTLSLLALGLIAGCSSQRIDLNPFDQQSADGSLAAAELIPVSDNTSSDDQREYPVRQPFPPQRDGGPSREHLTEYNNGSSTIKLRDDAPQQYTVVRGDTLWDISGLFLQDPWHWPEIWQVNPQIANPHLIYPGDVLSLVWVDGKPQIQVNRSGGGDGRMSPQIRVLPLDAAIPTIPFDAISAFLTKPSVLSAEEVQGMPYVLDIKESHIVAGSGFTIYTRGGDMEVGQRYGVMRIGEPLYDPDTRKLLGYESLYIGGGRMIASGDPAKMFLNETSREVLRGDRLISSDIATAQDFTISSPKYVVDGSIISVVDGVSLIGQYQVVIMNRGSRHGLVPGNVLSILQRGDVVTDRYADRSLFSRAWFAPKVKLPDEQAGSLMVFRTEENVSYGLVMQATSEIKVLDRVTNPQ